MSTFVIRRFEFSYNDEWYSADGGELGRIEAVFDTAAAAQSELQRLVAQFWRSEELCGHGTFYGETEDDLLERLNAFCLERCGKPLTDEDGDDYELPEGLSDADVFEFAKMANLMSHQVVEVPAGGGFVALWLPQEDRYLGGYGTKVDYRPSIDAFMDEEVGYRMRDAIPSFWQGTLDSISVSPLLLGQMISAQSEWLQYDEAQHRLLIKEENLSIPVQQLFALNALLKTPVFEVRQLNVQELLDLKA